MVWRWTGYRTVVVFTTTSATVNFKLETSATWASSTPAPRELQARNERQVIFKLELRWTHSQNRQVVGSTDISYMRELQARDERHCELQARDERHVNFKHSGATWTSSSKRAPSELQAWNERHLHVIVTISHTPASYTVECSIISN